MHKSFTLTLSPDLSSWPLNFQMQSGAGSPATGTQRSSCWFTFTTRSTSVWGRLRYGDRVCQVPPNRNFYFTAVPAMSEQLPCGRLRPGPSGPCRAGGRPGRWRGRGRPGSQRTRGTRTCTTPQYNTTYLREDWLLVAGGETLHRGPGVLISLPLGRRLPVLLAAALVLHCVECNRRTA